MTVISLKYGGTTRGVFLCRHFTRSLTCSTSHKVADIAASAVENRVNRTPPPPPLVPLISEKINLHYRRCQKHLSAAGDHLIDAGASQVKLSLGPFEAIRACPTADSACLVPPIRIRPRRHRVRIARRASGRVAADLEGHPLRDTE